MKIAAAIMAVIAVVLATPALAQYAVAPPPDDAAPPAGPLPPYAPPRFSATPPVDMLPPFEVMTIVRSMALDPISRPALRDAVYVVRAVDGEGFPVHVSIEARTGRVLRVTDASRAYPRGYALGGWPSGRAEDHMVPPETVPPGAAYPPLREIERRQSAAPYPPSASPPRLAARTPLPRSAPPRVKPAAPAPSIAALPDPKATPGKSVPAPVATRTSAGKSAMSSSASVNTAAKPADQGAITGAATPTNATSPDLKLVPVAPLE